MDREEKHFLFYQPAIESFGTKDVRSLRWNSLHSQIVRFKSLLRLGNMKNQSVLDLGCGYADFVLFLMKHHQEPSLYVGVDFIENFLQEARNRLSNLDIQFRLIKEDFMNFSFNEKFDFIYCNGALNFGEGDNFLLLTEVIQKFLPLAKKGLGLTLLKDAQGYVRDKRLFFYHREGIKKVLESLEIKGEIYEDYKDNDITLLIRKAAN